MRSLLMILLLCGSAHAGTVVITVVGAAPCVGTVCRATFTIPDAQITRFIKSYKASLGQVQIDPACVDNSNPLAPVLCPRLDRTEAETVKGWAKGIMQGTINNVTSGERACAQKTAGDAISEVFIPVPN